MTIIAVALIALAAADIAVTIVLVRAARRLAEPALEERATVAVILTFIAGLWAIVALAYLASVPLDVGLSTLLLVLVSALVSLPQLIWFAGYWAGRFR